VTANVLGVATGLDGRIWVMWGYENGGLAITRSNKAVTRFEPIQHVDPHAFTLHRLSGDGRLGPLDLLVDMIPAANGKVLPAGTFYARVLPELSATATASAVKNKAGTVIAHKLTLHVTDAGDPVAGANASAGGKSGKTDAKGMVELTLPGSAGAAVTTTITAPGYQTLSVKTTL
jgi:hypothetical protein